MTKFNKKIYIHIYNAFFFSKYIINRYINIFSYCTYGKIRNSIYYISKKFKAQ